MNTYQLLQDVLNNPSDSGQYWYSQHSLVTSTGLTQSNISKQLAKLTHNGLVKVEMKEHAPGKVCKHYCLFSQLDVQETALQAALAQLRTAVTILSNDLKMSKKLSIDEYQSLTEQIRKISATVKGDVQELSAFERQFNKIRSMFQNLSEDQVNSFTHELLQSGSNRGAITDKYLILNAEQA